MSSTYGENLHLTIFGQSHSPAIGVTVEGIPAGEKVDLDELQRFLNRRAPGKNAWSTPRKETDAPEILSGLVNGRTCGAPLTAIIRNTNTRSQDYENLALTPQTSRIDQCVMPAFALEINIDRIARCPGLVKSDHALLAEQIGVKTCGKQPLDRRIKHVEATGKAA